MSKENKSYNMCSKVDYIVFKTGYIRGLVGRLTQEKMKFVKLKYTNNKKTFVADKKNNTDYAKFVEDGEEYEIPKFIKQNLFYLKTECDETIIGLKTSDHEYVFDVEKILENYIDEGYIVVRNQLDIHGIGKCYTTANYQEFLRRMNYCGICGVRDVQLIKDGSISILVYEFETDSG